MVTYFPQHGESLVPSIPSRLWARRDGHRGQYLVGRGRHKRERAAQRREKSPPPCLGAGRGACSPLRVGNGRPPETWLYVQRTGCGRKRLCIGCQGLPEAPGYSLPGMLGKGAKEHPWPFQVKIAGAIALRYTYSRNRPAGGLSAVASPTSSLERAWPKPASSDPGWDQVPGIEWGRAVMPSKVWEAPPLLLLWRGHRDDPVTDQMAGQGTVVIQEEFECTHQ